ncbi:hypothetical protein JANAI62_03950 [Jannaschia pagri]|uniref:Uncharacterized protein n=1 Tax=Jannaschia pagri TaxID=2829797 RepID=A0ABQ4NH60_9RHOB|nr:MULTISPECIES: hypothetical protein [unclassified Jannaschia]GIT90122.1 hypothetical protein JANAI61_05800 [Jannaschia sp. AI_61]GIT93772.1 hypothetical protein JANAI62_03950 [Jannaschia sp. AI_62]
MNTSTIVFLINDHARAIEAVYEEGAKVELFKTLDPSIAVDDLIVVQSGTRHKMTVAKVTAVDVNVNFDSPTIVKWAVQRVDTPAFTEILQSESDAISAVQAAERRRKKEELRKTMFADHEASIAALKLTDRSDDDVVE